MGKFEDDAIFNLKKFQNEDWLKKRTMDQLGFLQAQALGSNKIWLEKQTPDGLEQLDAMDSPSMPPQPKPGRKSEIEEKKDAKSAVELTNLRTKDSTGKLTDAYSAKASDMPKLKQHLVDMMAAAKGKDGLPLKLGDNGDVSIKKEMIDGKNAIVIQGNTKEGKELVAKYFEKMVDLKLMQPPAGKKAELTQDKSASAEVSPTSTAPSPLRTAPRPPGAK